MNTKGMEDKITKEEYEHLKLANKELATLQIAAATSGMVCIGRNDPLSLITAQANGYKMLMSLIGEMVDEKVGINNISNDEYRKIRDHLIDFCEDQMDDDEDTDGGSRKC